MNLGFRKLFPARSGGSMKVGSKIFALVGFCLALLAAVAGVGIWQMGKIGNEVTEIADRDMPFTKSLTEVTIRQLEQSLFLERAFRLSEEMEGRDEVRKKYAESVRKIDEITVEIMKEFKVAISIAESGQADAATQYARDEFGKSLAVLQNITLEHKKYISLTKEAFALIGEGDIEEGHKLAPKIEIVQSSLEGKLEEILANSEDFTIRATETAEAQERFAFVLMLSIAGIAFTTGLGAAVVLIRRSISRPLSEVVTGINALTSGDLSLDVKVHNDDEIGAVAKAYAVFRENLVRTRDLEKEQKEKRLADEERKAMVANATSEFVSSIGDIVNTVSSASAELQTTSQSMSTIAEETSSQANAVAAASEEASSNVQTVASAAEQMSASISEINSQVTDASRAAKTAVESVAVTAGQMNALAQTADKIGNVVSIISDIAEQTNLLALNATIESARAGEAGKGFAVVASEVKALANETAKATESISAHIAEIQSATSEAVSSIDDVGQTIKQIEETSSAIAAAMEEQGIATQEVSRNVQEAASGTQEVSSNIAGVTQASQEAGAASEEVTCAASELSQQSEMLKTEVDKYLDRVKIA